MDYSSMSKRVHMKRIGVLLVVLVGLAWIGAKVVPGSKPAVADAPRAVAGPSPTLQDFIDQRYRAWATLELKRGHMYANRLEQVFVDHLGDPLTDFNTAWADQWLQQRLTTATDKTKSPPTRSTAARDLAWV